MGGDRPDFTRQPDCVFVFDITAFMHRALHVCYGDKVAEIPETDTRCVKHALGMIANLVDSLGIKQMVVAVDSPVPSLRCEFYPQYKAERKPHVPVLKASIPRFLAALRRVGILVVEQDRYEADDIIGSMVLAPRDFPVAIVTSDKDMWQYLRGDVVIYDPMAGEWREQSDCLNKFGVFPQSLCDYIGLVGDSSDGIPGVPGIGAKTAAKILSGSATLEDVYGESLSDYLKTVTSKKVQANLNDFRADAFLSRDLARPMIWADCPRLTCEREGLAAPASHSLRNAANGPL